MKRIALILLTAICITCFCFNISAENSATDIANIEVVFDKTSELSYEQKQIITEYFVNEKNEAQTYGLMCNLFGHKNTTEIVTTITHCASSTAPRCLEETWEVTTCSRCDNVETLRIGYAYKNCCP